MEGSATFTIAMSRTTMNCTTHRRARASHLRRSDVTVAAVTCVSEVMLSDRNSVYFTFTSRFFRIVTKWYPFGMAKRYEQYCPMAHALDLVGDRWALLVIRELMHGPKRYTDLVEQPPRHRDQHPGRAPA